MGRLLPLPAGAANIAKLIATLVLCCLEILVRFRQEADPAYPGSASKKFVSGKGARPLLGHSTNEDLFVHPKSQMALLRTPSWHPAFGRLQIRQLSRIAFHPKSKQPLWGPRRARAGDRALRS